MRYVSSRASASRYCFSASPPCTRSLSPFGGGIDALDAVFLVSLYAGYVVILLRGEASHEPQLGVAGYLQGFGRGKRIATVLAMFAYSGLIILIAVKPFAKGLEVLGPKIGLSPFFMIQWVAPLASESPEFIACACLVHKPRTTSAFNALISSKLNQWTLLIGTLVVVYSLSLGSYGVLSSTRSRLPRYSSRQRRACSPSVCFNSEMSVRGTSPSSLSSPSGFYQSSRVTRGYSRTACVVLAASLFAVRRGRIPEIVEKARKTVKSSSDAEVG